MAYADRTVPPEERVRAAASVVVIHAVIGVGVVLGLSVTGVIETPIPNPTATIITPADPPTTPPRPPLPEVPETQATPKNPVQVPETPFEFAPPSTNADVFNGETFAPTPYAGGQIDVPDLGPIGPAPSPSPSFTATGAVPRNGPAGWITNDDYSDRDLRRGNEGTAGYRLVIGSNGRVDACEITRSTGHSTLDNATCRLIRQRARFDAAQNDRGQTVVGTYSGTVNWQIPE